MNTRRPTIFPFVVLALLALVLSPSSGAQETAPAPAMQDSPLAPEPEIREAEESAVPPAAEKPTDGGETVWTGLWGGSLTLDGSELPASLTLFSDGGLMDIPSLKVFGWPVGSLTVRGSLLYFSISLGDDPLEGAGLRGGAAVSGVLKQGGRSGAFALRYADPQPDRSGDREVDTGRGVLPGTLVLPADSSKPVPLLILLPGSGTTDRNGNNWQVPGKNDSFRLLAESLAEAGIASYRYDKRGAGRAYRLGEDEASVVFEDHVKDAAACIRSFEGDGRFSRVVVFGHGDGALVGAAAMRDAPADALVAACVSGRTLRGMIAEAAAGAPSEYRAEIEKVMAELDAGRFVDEVSPYLENLFRRGFQPYLASWLRYELPRELADLSASGVPILLAQGDLDLQVTMEEFDLLRLAAPAAEAVLLPETNHMLKQVGNDVEKNYASFSDPSFPLSPGLVPAIQDFLTRVPARTRKTDPSPAP